LQDQGRRDQKQKIDFEACEYYRLDKEMV